MGMLVEGGFEIVGADESAAELRDRSRAHRAAHRAALDGDQTGPTDETPGSLPCGKPQPVGVGASAGVTIPVIRTRGAGTAEVPNT